MRTPPDERSRSQGRPAPMWSLSDRGLYWVSTMTSLMSELTQLLSVKSMIRYLPANGTAGLARTPDRMDRRSPSPPARTIAVTCFTLRSYTDGAPAEARDPAPGPRAGAARSEVVVRVERCEAAHDRP